MVVMCDYSVLSYGPRQQDSRCQNCDQDPLVVEKCHINVNVLTEDLGTHASISNIRKVKMCKLGFRLPGI
jgi:hypothetical protein